MSRTHDLVEGTAQQVHTRGQGEKERRVGVRRAVVPLSPIRLQEKASTQVVEACLCTSGKDTKLRPFAHEAEENKIYGRSSASRATDVVHVFLIAIFVPSATLEVRHLQRIASPRGRCAGCGSPHA